MKLYHIPGTCTVGIQALLEELRVPYELEAVGAPDSAERSRYRQLNPKGKVPALQLDDGNLLTEFPAIALYLARQYGDGKLLGNSALEEARIFALMDYIVSTGHMLGFSRIRRPERFSEYPRNHPEIQQLGLTVFQACLDHCEATLEGKEFAFGEISLADFALLYIERWSASDQIGRMGENCLRHYAAMTSRPSVTAALG